MSNPKQIWLAPDCDGECDREWCQEDVWSACDDCGSESVKYVLASDCDQIAADNKRLREALQSIDRHNDNPARYDAHIDQIIKAALSNGKEVM